MFAFSLDNITKGNHTNIWNAVYHRPGSVGEYGYFYVYCCARTGGSSPNAAYSCSCIPDNTFDDFRLMFPSRLVYSKWLWTLSDLMTWHTAHTQRADHSYTQLSGQATVLHCCAALMGPLLALSEDNQVNVAVFLHLSHRTCIQFFSSLSFSILSSIRRHH